MVHQRKTADPSQRVSRGVDHGSCPIDDALDSIESVDRRAGTVSTSDKPSAFKSAFVVPRRPAPPRRKKAIPRLTDGLPPLLQVEETPVPEAEILLSTPVPAVESSPPSKDETLVPTKDSSLSASPTPAIPGDHIDVPEGTRTPSPPREDLPPSSEGTLTGVVEGGVGIGEYTEINERELNLGEPLAGLLREEPTKPGTILRIEDEPNMPTTEPGVAADKPEKQPEEEDEEATRIAARVVESGSLETLGLFERTLHKEQKQLSKEPTSPAKSPMFAVDGGEIIGQVISLEGHVAALQGNDAFDSARSPPKPMTKKPKQKLPPKPVSPPSSSMKKSPADLEAVIHYPPFITESTETLPEKPTGSEERQRRVAIAARVQRLGKPGIGTGPPVIAPKPLIRRVSVPKEGKTRPGACCNTLLVGGLLRLRTVGSGVTPPPVVPEDELKETGETRPEGTPSGCPCFRVANEVLGSKGPVDKSARSISTSHKSPASMPIPAAPRRAAPPRRKKTPKLSYESPAEEEIPLPESTSVLLADAGLKIQVPPDPGLKSVPTVGSPPPAKDESPESANDSILVTEKPTLQTLVQDGHHDKVSVDTRAPPPPEEDQPTPSLPEQVPQEPLAGTPENEPIELDAAVDGEDKPNLLTAEPDVTEGKPEGGTEAPPPPLSRTVFTAHSPPDSTETSVAMPSLPPPHNSEERPGIRHSEKSCPPGTSYGNYECEGPPAISQHPDATSLSTMPLSPFLTSQSIPLVRPPKDPTKTPEHATPPQPPSILGENPDIPDEEGGPFPELPVSRSSVTPSQLLSHLSEPKAEKPKAETQELYELSSHEGDGYGERLTMPLDLSPHTNVASGEVEGKGFHSDSMNVGPTAVPASHFSVEPPLPPHTSGPILVRPTPNPAKTPDPTVSRSSSPSPLLQFLGERPSSPGEKGSLGEERNRNLREGVPGPSQPGAETQKSHEVISHGSEEHNEDLPSMSLDLPPSTGVTPGEVRDEALPNKSVDLGPAKVRPAASLTMSPVTPPRLISSSPPFPKSLEERPDSLNEEETSSPLPLSPSRSSVAPPPQSTALSPIPHQPAVKAQEPHEVASRTSEERGEESPTVPFDPPRYMDINGTAGEGVPGDNADAGPAKVLAVFSLTSPPVFPVHTPDPSIPAETPASIPPSQAPSPSLLPPQSLDESSGNLDEEGPHLPQSSPVGPCPLHICNY